MVQHRIQLTVTASVDFPEKQWKVSHGRWRWGSWCGGKERKGKYNTFKIQVMARTGINVKISWTGCRNINPGTQMQGYLKQSKPTHQDESGKL